MGLNNLLRFHRTRRFRLLTATFLCFNFVCKTATAKVYYVSPTAGNADNPGTSINAPWTLAKAKSTARDGDVIYLLAGNYSATTFGMPGDAAGTADAWITYQSDPAHPFGAKFSSITFQGDRPLYIKIMDLDVECVSGKAAVQVVSNASSVIIKNCKIHGKANGNGPSYANVLVSGTKDVLVEDCEIYYSGRTGHGVQLDASKAVVIRRCHVHDIVSSGIRTSGGEYYTIEYNRIHDQREDWNPEIHGSGISIHSHYTTIRGNIVYDYGNTRPIRFYQSWAGPDGYHDMLVENNLVFKTPGYSRVMWWPEFIDVGPRCIFRNNTFLLSCWIYFAQNADGSGLSIHNNVFAGGLTLDNFGTTTTLRTQTCAQSRAKWDFVSEGNNIFRSLNANGNGYICSFSKFAETSNSIVAGNSSYFAVGSFFESRDGEYPYQLAQNSPAIGFGDPANTAMTDLLGQTRDTTPDVGCYERIGFSGNRPPILATLANQEATVGINLTLEITGTDLDGDAIQFSVSGLPEGASFSEQVFTWTPAPGQIGVHQVTFTVSDGQAQDSKTITITVSRPNAAPILGGIGNKSVNENQTLSFTVSATDADGDSLTYSAIGLPDGATFTGQTFAWTPGFTQAGSYSVTFTVSDGKTQDSQTITISVVNVNRPPTLAAIGDRSISEDETLALTISGTDPDGTVLTYSASGLPVGATFTGQNFSWTPGADQVGSHQITFTVSDGSLTASETIAVMVVGSAPDTTAPVVARQSPAPGTIQVPLNNLITFHVTDAGKGVNASSVTVLLDDQIIYQGNTALYTSALGRCIRSGSKHDYQFTYQHNEQFEFDHEIRVTVNAADLAGNVMSPTTYSFSTEMRTFGSHHRVSQVGTLAKGAPVTVGDAAGNMWAAWHAGPVGARDIFLARRPAGQNDFDNPVQITNHPLDQCHPDLALASDGTLYVVWQDNRKGHWNIYLSVSTDSGRTFSKETAVADVDNNQTAPAVVVDGASPGRVYVAWQDDRNGNQDIYVAHSTNAFAGSTVTRVTTNTADQTEPDMAVGADDTVYLVWTDRRNGQADLYAAASNASWANVPLVTGAGDQTSPALAVTPGGSTVHLLWVNRVSGNADVYYVSFNDLPSSPLSGVNIIDDTSGADQAAPSIACNSAGKVFACWQDDRNIGAYGTDTDLYFTELSNGAVKTNVLLSGSARASRTEPAIALSADEQPYIVWAESRDSYSDIYWAATTYLDSTPLYSATINPTSQTTIGTSPEAIARTSDVSIVVPAGAYPSGVRVTISKILNPVVSPEDCLGSYDFGPSGIEFNQPITVTIPYPADAFSRPARAYWYNSLTGALSQQGITDVENIVINSNLHALRFKTTHFTPYYLVANDAKIMTFAGTDGSSGGCSMSTTGNGSPRHLLVPYAVVVVFMAVLRHKDKKRAAERFES